MSTTIAPPILTGDDLFALPDDGIEREFIRGQLRERPMTRLNRRHSRTTARLARFLDLSLDQRPEPKGEILVGDAAFRLRKEPESTVGIDVAYVSHELSAKSPDETFLIEGPPVLAAEILSPTDEHKDIVEKIELYLETGVAVVWIVDPDLRNVTVFRPRQQEMLFAAAQELVGDQELPGFRVNVAHLFGR
jgi:Uma2 family endonuclease